MKIEKLNQTVHSTSTQQSDISYNTILNNIGRQLKERQALIAKRVTFVSLPLIATSIPLIYIGKITEDTGLTSEQKGVIFLILLSLTLFVSFPWALVMGQIFKTERIIWVDSFFDSVPLTSKESWRMAKKLFWPSVNLSFQVFIRYYLPAVLVSIGILASYLTLVFNDRIPVNGWVTIGLFVGVIITFTLYAHFIRIHLRYLSFLFIDTYNTKGFTYQTLFSEMRLLNQTTKLDDFKKMLVTLLGTEAVESVTGTLLGMLNGRITSRMGGAGQAAGAAVATYANEVIVVNKKFAQTVTFYVYYRVAQQLIYGNTQTINTELYATLKATEKQ